MDDILLTDEGTREWARDAFRETLAGSWPDINVIADCVVDEVARVAVRNALGIFDERFRIGANTAFIANTETLLALRSIVEVR